MPSRFSPALRIELIGSGEQSGVWGNTTNNNLGDLIEQAISGATDLNVTSGDITLTALNGVVDQARSAVLSIVGSAGVTRTVTIPNDSKPYTVKNRSDATVNLKTASGTAFEIPTLSEAYVYCDGDDVITGRVITDGANAITSLAAPFTSPALTGTPTAPTAAVNTNTTQIATTAFVNAEIAADTANLAPKASPAFTGAPTAPTASAGTNTTQLATTAYVVARVAQDAPTKTGTGASGTWGISITGNAATATSATNATNAANATKLGNVAASSYARRDTTNAFTGLNTFTNGNIRSPAYNFTGVTSVFHNGDSNIQMAVNTGVRLTIDSAGNLTISGDTAVKASGSTWLNPSDARLKENVVNYTKGLDELVQVQPRSFVFNGKGGSSTGLKAVGIIADEIEQVLPSTVSTRLVKLNIDDDQETEVRYFDSSELTWVMVNAIKELKSEVDALKAQIGNAKT